MLHKGKFRDFVDGLTLSFKLSALSERLRHFKEEQIRGLTPRKVYIIFFAILQLLFTCFLCWDSYNIGDMYAFDLILISATVCVFCFMIEYLIHVFDRLKMFRGCFIATGIFFSTVLADSVCFSIPAVRIE